MPEHPSLDPRRTLDRVPSSEVPPTVAAAGAHPPAGATGPFLPAPPGDAPSIPGYRITAAIARGGMGRVYAAHDLALDREVAIKTLLPGADAERFVTEAKITARLPHPGIPPVHALGALADGTPYLAMKLIRGRTLAELLKERPSPLAELPRFVQVFEQVAQAVGFAHAQGILHRDLKPLNVMVGAFGEVQVMDWGLAKDVASGERERQEELPEADSVTHTAAGAVLGTPGYMAPEQARGEAVDARADVFALGATLAAILTGRPAFVGASQREVIDRAARADLADVRQRLTSSGADAELIALALACLSADVARRPADGRAVAAEVAAYRAGVEARLKQAETERAEALVREAEQRKRRRTVQVGGGVIAVVLVAGLSVSLWQMFRANAERDAKDEALQAETRAREQAFTALRSMTDVFDKRFAQTVILTDDDRAFLRGIIEQFDAFAAIKGDDADSWAVRAEGRARVGLMRHKLGELQEAEQDYDQALSIRQQLAADFPARTDFRQALARTHHSRGNLLRETGRQKEAALDYDQALNIQQRLAADFPFRPEFRQELAQSHNNRAILLRATGRLGQAEQDYDQALGIQQQLAADFPARTDFRQELAQSHNNRAMLLRDAGRLKEAEQDCDQAVGIYKQLAAEFPSRPEFHQELASSHSNRGLLLGATGRLKEAEQDYDQALSIRKRLAADFPFRPEFRLELATSHNNRGLLLGDTGRLKEAEQDYDAALGIQQRLAADFPARPEFRQVLAKSHNNRGTLLYNARRLPEAEKDYDQALNIRKQLAAEFPWRPEFRQELATSHYGRGNVLSATGRLPEAEQDYDAALGIQKQLAADFPSRPEFRQELARSHNVRGNLLRATGRVREAEQDYDQALSIRMQLAVDLPNQLNVRNELAGTCVNLALHQQQQGDWVAAKRLLLEGRPHHLAALKANPRHPNYRQFYRNHLNVLTWVHAGLLEPEYAVRTAETRRDLGWEGPADAYDAAGFLSQCIPIVAKHDKLDERQRKEAVQFYGDAAMRLLRDAVGKGYKDVAQLKKDSQLNPLHQREDFQKLVAELEGKGK